MTASDAELARARAEKDVDRAADWWSEAEPESPTDLCVCGHRRRGHQMLCNAQVGKFWCRCREFVAKEATA